MPDGKRKRRFSTNRAKRKWYALFRSLRFRRRFASEGLDGPISDLRRTWILTQLNRTT
jgi:hypothetical protein